MALTSGTKLGPYEIVAPLGAGGMGEVYRARDTRLDRTVAIKVLPAQFAADPQFRERFDREARAISSLNHPHICTLYDVGHQDGTDYLVMEYLEGETIAQRLNKGALPLDQALRYAIEIAGALDKAHRAGITHRDLKPGNIMLTKSGTKLLDFGLARLRPTGAPMAMAGLSGTPTWTSPLGASAGNPLTGQGSIIGTLHYMSPEQVEGKEADARSDIFAFGTILYEMATGKRAFEGKSSASVLAAILEREPPAMNSLQPMTPPALDRVVKKCLAKEPEQRWQSASDLADELKWISGGGAATSPLPTAEQKSAPAIGRRLVIIGLLTALFFGAAVASLITWNLRSAPPAKPVSRFVITLPPGQRFESGQQTSLALSPDGAQLAYVATEGNTPRLYLRALDSLDTRPLPGTEGASNPFFSPDGQWLAFYANAQLKKVAITGGAVITLAQASAVPRGATWGSQGTIVFANAAGVLQRIPDAGGSPQPLSPLGKVENSLRWPEFLPGGQAVLFATGAASATGEIAAQLIGSGERRDLIQVQGVTPPRYATSGHVVYAHAGNLMAVPFDPWRLEVTGAAVPVLEGIRQATVTGAAQFSISATGTLVYVGGFARGDQSTLVWVDRTGKEQPLAAPARVYETPRISPDGRRVAVTVEGQVWLYNLSRETFTRFTFEGSTNNRPVWTPDGKRIAFYSNKDGPTNIFWQLADGSGGLERLTTSNFIHVPTSFSSDGQLLAFHEANPDTGNDMWVLRLSDRKTQPILRTPFDEGAPRFSPDGRWLAYVSNESGRNEIYVQPYPGPGGKWLISTEGGMEPVWNPNGRELFYRSEKKLMAVDITTKPSFAVGKPHTLFEGPYVQAVLPIFNYDVSPDGQRFLMIKPVEQEHAAPSQINVVLNWFEELKRRVPTEKK
jgi:serine/threonine-protein kinase